MMERAGGGFDWSMTHNSPFELSNLALVNFMQRKHQSTDLNLLCRNTGKTTIVKAKPSYKFLGVYIDSKLNWKTQDEDALARGAKWVNLLQ